MPFIYFNIPVSLAMEEETTCPKDLNGEQGDGLTRRERKNQRRRESIQCPTCGKTINRGSMSKHVKTHSRVKKFQCKICGRSYDRQDFFMKHMALHVDNKPFKCSVCGKAFSLARKLISHETVHTGLKPFICSLCHTSFTESSALYKHVRSMHEGNKPYECSFCGKSFNESAKVKRHMRIHTGEKPFVCSVCGRAFNDESAMLKHVRNHKEHDSSAARTPSFFKDITEVAGSSSNSSNDYEDGDGSGEMNSCPNQSTILEKLLTAPFEIKQEIESDVGYGMQLSPIHSYCEEGQGVSLTNNDNNNNGGDDDRKEDFQRRTKNR